ncbi:pyridoxamine 5'-phosphate oxidase family protein [Aquihabitans sp. G128]|uniref:pyridoxamine 5'-phosphate oxidase family protein n=1 Tax=Aquihabitans sp. G128 TaxID=2849779 RepID=UPI001C23D64B|nr:pyridoxamine 5'-phosphate oxidase family protein [Aquihabitans sp. G128]QXC62506.1 pyridoxamine 5'-phosphate oxidase family protein [Aquihabitans sp. G128]
MATWSELADAAPDLAATGERLLTQFGPGLGFLATVRADGGPRLHPICPVVVDGGLWAFIIEASPKCADLRRDGRFALHAFPPEEVDDEFVVHGRATEVDPSPELHARICAATTAQVGRDDEALFALTVDRAMSATYEARGVFPPAYETWSDPAAAP